MDQRIVSGVSPNGIVYADRNKIVRRDYKRLGILSFRTLELELAPDCPDHLAQQIKKHAARLQKMKGQEYQVSACGQTVILGYGILEDTDNAKSQSQNRPDLQK